MLERSVEEIRVERIVPMLDRVATVTALVAAYETGEFDEAGAFGYTHTARNMAACYRRLERLPEGRERYFAYVDRTARTLSRFDGTRRVDRARGQGEAEFRG